jgi:hypothetical protein
VTRDYKGTSFVNDHDKDHKVRDKEPQSWHMKMTCRNCNKKGHIASFCPDFKPARLTSRTEKFTKRRRHSSLMALRWPMKMKITMLICSYAKIKNTGVYLSSSRTALMADESRKTTTNAFSNPHLLKDIHQVRGSLTIHTQAGKAVTKLRGTVPGYGEVWFCPDGIANILSLARVAKSRLVTFNSTNSNHFAVTRDDGSKRIFRQSEHGLYYYVMHTSKRDA